MARTITATDELTVDTAHADVADHGAVFEINDYDDLTAMHEAHAQRGQPADPATIAAEVTGQARTHLSQWRHTLTMMAATSSYTTVLRPHGIYRRHRLTPPHHPRPAL
ncbi:hypothetical protein ACIBQ1_36895 [Nonomuraea sp. NPDC050153]|uniref:hypothetical protein n=1 Tax=Nonomuraea sp. NPDC050153 TaxID=3364359 RepID=UPI003788EFAD